MNKMLFLCYLNITKMEKKNTAVKKISKKEARQLVYDKLAAALSGIKPEGKGKKFENSLRTTSKLFANYLRKAG